MRGLEARDQPLPDGPAYIHGFSTSTSDDVACRSGSGYGTTNISEARTVSGYHARSAEVRLQGDVGARDRRFRAQLLAVRGRRSERLFSCAVDLPSRSVRRGWRRLEVGWRRLRAITYPSGSVVVGEVGLRRAGVARLVPLTCHLVLYRVYIPSMTRGMAGR